MTNIDFRRLEPLEVELRLRAHDVILRALFRHLAHAAPNERRSVLRELSQLREEASDGMPAELSVSERAPIVHLYRKCLDETLSFIEAGVEKK